MSLERFIQAMPKVELHVHLEGAIQPESLLILAERNGVQLPGRTVEELHRWFRFTDFNHFVDIYLTISRCIQTPDDIEWITRRFLEHQAAQNILYSEVTYTAYTHYLTKGLPFAEQLAAVNRARLWAEKELGTRMGLVLDIPRHMPAEAGLMVADWAIGAMDKGVVAFGLGGPEVGYPPENFRQAFQKTNDAGLASVPHAGETVGPASIWGALRDLGADRIGHGVRCLEDPQLVAYLRERQIPLEICPTSNICLNLFPEFAAHPLPRLLEEGLFITLNSDDPPMFNTSLTQEYQKVAETFNFGVEELRGLVLNGVRAGLMPPEERLAMERHFEKRFDELKTAYLS